ncbi:MAG TPA: hypothetical protein VL284_14560 [Thermoanaerobaculia bacterium]|nr:hypothetical protein [Thermoanaerobaculia bacterium]
MIAAIVLAAALQPRNVTLDRRDEDVHKVLESMQQQCAIRNLVIDPDVQGKASFYMHDVPCAKAFDVVLHTFRLRAVVETNSLTAVEPER